VPRGRVLVRLFSDLLSPPSCAACDAALATSTTMLCRPCAATVERCPSGDEPWAFGYFGGALATVVKRLKYAGRPDLARPLGHLLRERCRALRLSAEVVVPVPIHPRRLAERGYNQAALLAAHVAVEVRARVAATALQRTIDVPQQAGLDRAGRWANVAAAFQVRHGPSVAGRRVLLVDDVATTGATLGACSGVLLAAGAASVGAIVVARTALESAARDARKDCPAPRIRT